MRFAMLNGGEYPENLLLDTTPEGDTVVNLLPGGVLLENPFVLVATEPVDGVAASYGQVGYTPVVVPGGSHVGFVITGVGMTQGTTIFTAGCDPDCSAIIIYDEYIYCSGDCCF